MAQIVSLAANLRTETGKGPARQARFRGQVPGVIYGHGRSAQSLTVEAKALEQALTGIEPASTIIELGLDGKKTKTLIREIQRHPIRPDIIHVDFYEIHADEKITLKVPIHPSARPMASATPVACWTRSRARWRLRCCRSTFPTGSSSTSPR